jgi:hypothetical protein
VNLRFLPLLFAAAFPNAGPAEILNPFAPPPVPLAEQPAENLPVTLEGVVSSSQSRLFAFHDTVNRRSFFLAIDQAEKDQDIVVRGFDEERGVVRLEYRGRLTELALAPAKIGVGNPAVFPASFPSPAKNSSSVASAQLETAAALIKERRLKRNGASSPTPPPSGR